ncbi:MAG: lysophospholipid acyltransferase family protein, partial [Synergistaceae bacterium]|nr:lysophospholipid acyltransferase family protein [Synergistaceae bacterium]
VADQHAGDEGIVAPFLGHDTGTVRGPAVLAYLTGAEILPMQAIRLAPFKFKVIVDEPIKWTKGPNRDDTIRDVTILCNQALEKMILRCPGQWLWQHRRFREALGD